MIKGVEVVDLTYFVKIFCLHFQTMYEKTSRYPSSLYEILFTDLFEQTQWNEKNI